MANLALVRIDSRLIHGQVVTMWIKRTEAKRIIIVDNEITADPFMAQIFSMAAPPGVKLELMTTDQAGEGWQKDQFGSLGPIVCLFKNVPVMYEAYNKGYNFPKLQVGGIGGGPGRVNVVGPITLDENDAKMLNELSNKGLEIVFQATPDTKEGDWKSVKAKFFPNV